MLGLRCCGSYQLYQYAGNVPSPRLTRGWQRNSSVRGADWIMGDGCHVMTRHCVTMSGPPPPVLLNIYIIRYLEGDHLSEPRPRNREEAIRFLQLPLSITNWHNVGHKRIWRVLTVLLIPLKNCIQNIFLISHPLCSVFNHYLFYLSNTNDDIDNYSFSLHHTLDTTIQTGGDKQLNILYQGNISSWCFFHLSQYLFLTFAASKGEYIS